MRNQVEVKVREYFCAMFLWLLKVTVMVVMVGMMVRVEAQEDKCPRPDEIAPCQCRTRGPSIQVR